LVEVKVEGEQKTIHFPEGKWDPLIQEGDYAVLVFKRNVPSFIAPFLTGVSVEKLNRPESLVKE